MKYEEITHYSSHLERNMTFGIYGHAGKILLAFAPQDGKHGDYAGFGMVEMLAPWIDAGRLMVVTPDSVDEESWSDRTGNPAWRGVIQERFYHYIMDELVPMLQHKTNNFSHMMTTGCSMGAFHAANFFFRRPDVFDAVISLSGFYRAQLFFDGYMDENVYNNSPADFIRNMPANHPYLKMYGERSIIICIGQGAWEGELIPETQLLERVLAEKQVSCWFDYWGYDVYHDWPWWKKQIVYFMEKVMGPA